MCANEILDLVKNLHLLVLPSTLWAVHIDPKHEFLAVLHVSVDSEKMMIIDKGVLIRTENCILKTSISVNDKIIQIPNVPKIESVSDLAAVIYILRDIKICLNSTSKCNNYVFDGTSSFCDTCSFEVFSEMQPSTDNFDETIEDPRNRKSHLCTVCGKTFNCSSGLDHHMLTHAPPDDKPFKCKVCTRAFAKKYNLNVHVRVHSGERPYVCSKCGKTYSTRSNLSTHMNSAHCEEKRHPCDLCDMTFVHPRVLRIHMRKHTGEKPFACQVCGKVFSKKIHLTIHMRTHTGEKPHVCVECGKGFTTTGNLNSHRKINHNTIQ